MLTILTAAAAATNSAISAAPPGTHANALYSTKTAYSSVHRSSSIAKLKVGKRVMLLLWLITCASSMNVGIKTCAGWGVRMSARAAAIT